VSFFSLLLRAGGKDGGDDGATEKAEKQTSKREKPGVNNELCVYTIQEQRPINKQTSTDHDPRGGEGKKKPPRRDKPAKPGGVLFLFLLLRVSGKSWFCAGGAPKFGVSCLGRVLAGK
jgi:hypothetical protein